jgi:tRNA uridine 5-carboxymethylaminomethyl modification enzyme
VDQLAHYLDTHQLAATEEVNALLRRFESAPLRSSCSLAQILRRPEISINQIRDISPDIPNHGPNVDAQTEIQLKYQGYVDRQSAIVERFRRMEQATIPANLDYAKISGLSREACEKLVRIKPQSLGQAARIPGITPAAISLLSFYIKKKSA